MIKKNTDVIKINLNLDDKDKTQESISNFANFSDKNTIEMFSDTIKSIKESQEYVEELHKILISFVDSLQSFFRENHIKESIDECSRYFSMFNLLNEVGWPFFMYIEDSDYESLKNIFDEDNLDLKKELVSKFIFDICDIEFVKATLDEWLQNNFISCLRKPLLVEAIKCYENELYGGCVSLLICQLNGVITDLFEQAQTTIDFNEEFFCYLYRELHPQDTSTNKKIVLKMTKGEKNRLVTMMCNSDSDFCLVWEAMVKYMIKVIYTNNKNYDENQPCRNKIAHGEQTNFNTKEHALKCILILDLIINFSDSLLNNTL